MGDRSGRISFWEVGTLLALFRFSPADGIRLVVNPNSGVAFVVYDHRVADSNLGATAVASSDNFLGSALRRNSTA